MYHTLRRLMMKIMYEFDTTTENFDRYEYARISKSLDMALAFKGGK